MTLVIICAFIYFVRIYVLTSQCRTPFRDQAVSAFFVFHDFKSYVIFVFCPYFRHIQPICNFRENVDFSKACPLPPFGGCRKFIFCGNCCQITFTNYPSFQTYIGQIFLLHSNNNNKSIYDQQFLLQKSPLHYT